MSHKFQHLSEALIQEKVKAKVDLSFYPVDMAFMLA